MRNAEHGLHTVPAFSLHFHLKTQILLRLSRSISALYAALSGVCGLRGGQQSERGVSVYGENAEAGTGMSHHLPFPLCCCIKLLRKDNGFGRRIRVKGPMARAGRW